MTDKVPLLLVDDRRPNLVALQGLLGHEEFDLDLALSGQEALRASLGREYALILLDAQMPDMDGFETAELLRANPKTRHVPIIFVTAGMRQAAHEFKGYEAGAVDYLLKPIEPPVLRAKVRVFCELYRQRLRLEQSERELQRLVDERSAELRRALDGLAHSLAEKEVLLKEVYHRVKNNLQVICSLLSLQARASDEPAVCSALQVSADRVRSIGLVHEMLYQSHDLSSIGYPAYVQRLVDHLTHAYDPLSRRVPIRAEIDDLQFAMDTAIPLGLVITELISNAYKHAFPDHDERGEICVSLHALDDGRLRLMVRDTGRGLPPESQGERGTMLGLRLVKALVGQLRGQLASSSSDGTCFEVTFRPVERNESASAAPPAPAR